MNTPSALHPNFASSTVGTGSTGPTATADPELATAIPVFKDIPMILSKEPRLAGKVAIVTGGASGLGQATALTYAKHGAKVVIVDIDKKEADAKATVEQIKAMGGTAIAVVADVRNPKDCETAVKAGMDLNGGNAIDVLAHYAGITQDNNFILMTPEQWKDVIDINLTGTFNMAQAVAKNMRKAVKKEGDNIKPRSMIFTSSVSGLEGIAGQANYSASKGGVDAFTRTIAQELSQMNIRVNTIAPGFVEGTGMTNPNGVEKPWFKVARYLQEKLGLKRGMCQAKDIANTALFLASDESAHTTGQTFRADNGMKIFNGNPAIFSGYNTAA